VQELVGRRWVTRGGPVREDGGSVRFRAGAAEGRVALRTLGADGVGSKALRVSVRALRMAAVGDINLSPAPLGAISGGDVAAPWSSVGPRLRAADLAFGNLETAVSTRGTPQEKQFRFRSSPASVAAMVRLAGMDVVNLANNHSGDYGRDATLDTLRYVRASGMTPVGAGKDAAEAYRPQIVERLGLRIAFVGFSNILPYEFRAGASTPGTAWATPDAVRSSVRRAAREADVVIATFHWGTELQTKPADGQASLARDAILAGATAVIGAHPHVLQPTIGVGRDRVIAYSLGNFVFPAHSAGTTRTGILELRLGAGKVLSRSFVPATIRGSMPVLTGR
jgi:poly-gamma-glutamate capsule biosynthesis protein CapA/YwtB (metallophosphatase superfamily)